MAVMASKQQTTALFLSTIVTRTTRHTELTKKSEKPDGKPVLCQRTFSSDFCAVFYTNNLLKPTGHVMHHQFNIQQLYALHTQYLCVLYLSENKQRLVPLRA
jgi:hypothetical protein